MLNKVMVIGNLGADPEMRYTANGSAVTNFNVATNREYTTGDGERRQETEWFRVVTWNRLAEICSQYLSKGRQVYVEGRLQTRSWEDREGQTRYTTEVVARDMQMLDSRGDASGGYAPPPHGGGAQERGQPARSAAPAADAADDLDDLDDDIPF